MTRAGFIQSKETVNARALGQPLKVSADRFGHSTEFAATAYIRFQFNPHSSILPRPENLLMERNDKTRTERRHNLVLHHASEVSLRTANAQNNHLIAVLNLQGSCLTIVQSYYAPLELRHKDTEAENSCDCNSLDVGHHPEESDQTLLCGFQTRVT